MSSGDRGLERSDNLFVIVKFFFFGTELGNKVSIYRRRISRPQNEARRPYHGALFVASGVPISLS